MTKILLLVFTLILGALMVAPVWAAPNIGVGAGGTADQVAKGAGFTTVGITDTSLSESVGKVIKTVLTMVGTIFFVLTVYAGFLWMTAGGNEEQVTKATGILKMAVIGLIITLSSYGITLFVLIKVAGSAGTSGNVVGQ